MFIVTPALCSPVRPQSAGVTGSATDHREDAGGGQGGAELFVAPADCFPFRIEPAHMRASHGYRRKPGRRRHRGQVELAEQLL